MTLKIEPNGRTGGRCATFKHNGKWYYADVCQPFDFMAVGRDTLECMIFEMRYGKLRKPVLTAYADTDVPMDKLLTESVEKFTQGAA